MYNDFVLEHLANPRNEGEIENPDGVGVARSPLCNDEIVMTIRVKNDVIDDIRFRTLACGAAIATSSIATELFKGKRIEEALRVTGRHVLDAMGGLPENKMTCTLLAHDAFRAAVEDFRKKVEV